VLSPSYFDEISIVPRYDATRAHTHTHARARARAYKYRYSRPVRGTAIFLCTFTLLCSHKCEDTSRPKQPYVVRLCNRYLVSVMAIGSICCTSAKWSERRRSVRPFNSNVSRMKTSGHRSRPSLEDMRSRLERRSARSSRSSRNK